MRRPPLLNLQQPEPLDLKEGTQDPATFKPILHTIQPGGSGTGISFYSTWAECPMKATLNEEAAKNYGDTSFTGTATNIGTVFHAFLELYYQGKDFSPAAVQFQQINGSDLSVEEKARIEAERLFRAYAKQFPADEFGEPVGVETLLPENPQQAHRIEEAVGISPFTMKADLVVKLNKKVSEKVRRNRHIDVTSGYYMIDHKTQSSARSNMIDYYKNSLQFHAYQLAWNAAFPKRPLNGLIANVVVKTKEPKFISILVPPPSKAQVQSLHQFLAGVVHIMETMPEWKNTSACYKMGTCLWAQTGDCLRY